MQKSSTADLASEVAYVKSLAEEGRNAPLVGGVHYVIWGVAMAAAALATYGRSAGLVTWPFVGGVWFWAASLGIGWAASFAIGARETAKPGALTIGNQTARAAWLGIGVFMSLFWIASMLFEGRLKAAGVEPRFLYGLMFPLAFGLYGVAFFATAIAARLDWMRGIAAASWIFSIAALYFLGDARQFLVGAAGSLICAALPGIILIRHEPSDLV